MIATTTIRQRLATALHLPGAWLQHFLVARLFVNEIRACSIATALCRAERLSRTELARGRAQ